MIGRKLCSRKWCVKVACSFGRISSRDCRALPLSSSSYHLTPFFFVMFYTHTHAHTYTRLGVFTTKSVIWIAVRSHLSRWMCSEVLSSTAPIWVLDCRFECVCALLGFCLTTSHSVWYLCRSLAVWIGLISPRCVCKCWICRSNYADTHHK